MHTLAPRTAVTLTVWLLVGTSRLSVADEAEWISLFNGRDLAGWKANTDSAAFTVVDGAIRAQATHPTHRSHLYYVGESGRDYQSFVDFELVVTARSEPNSNSGIFFHTDHETRDARLHLKNGYEVQLNSTPTEQRKTGSLYTIVDLDQSPVDETQWFNCRTRVQGQRIQVWINDQPVVDYTEPPNPERPASRSGRLLRTNGGGIALQAHDPGSVFYFQSVRIRELPPAAVPGD